MSNYKQNDLAGDLAPVNSETKKIQEAVSSQLDRNPASGQDNAMETELDMNSFRVINVGKPENANDAARLKDVNAVTAAGLPDQTGEAGKFLTTDGEIASWATVSPENGVFDLTAAEVNQLKNINTVTVSNQQWAYLGNLDQGVSTSDDIEFNTLTLDGNRVYIETTDNLLVGPDHNPAASSGGNILIGYQISTTGSKNVIISQEEAYAGENSFVVGEFSSAGNNAVVLGHDLQPNSDNSVSILSTAANNSVGILGGGGGENSVAIGSGSIVYDNNSVVIGNNASAAIRYSVAIGPYASTSGLQSVAIGRQASTADHYSIAIGDNASTADIQSVAIGNYASTADTQSIAIGDNASTADIQSVAIGNNASTEDRYSVAIGDNASTEDFYSVAIGHNASTEDRYSVAIGNLTHSDGQNSVSIGTSTSASGSESIALGTNAEATVSTSTAIGNGAYSGRESIVISNDPAGNAEAVTEAINIGHRGTAASNTAHFGDDYINETYLYGTVYQDGVPLQSSVHEKLKRDAVLWLDFTTNEGFVKNSDLSVTYGQATDLITYTAPDGQTGINAAGQIVEAGIDNPPIVYDENGKCLGLQVVPWSENLLFWSDDFTQNTDVTGGPNITPSHGDSPLGENTSTLIQFAGADSLVRKTTTSLTSGDVASGTVLIKGTASETIRIDGLSNIQTSPNITLTGKWQYVYFTGEADESNDSVTINTYGGVTARDVEVAFVQLEPGHPTPPIFTENSQVTRADTLASKTGIQVPSDAVSIFFDVNINASAQSSSLPSVFGISDGTSSNRVVARVDSSDGTLQFLIDSDLGANVARTGSAALVVGRNKLAAVIGNGQYRLLVNGSVVFQGSVSNYDLSVMGKLDIGHQNAAGFTSANMTCRSGEVIPYAISTAEGFALTTLEE